MISITIASNAFDISAYNNDKMDNVKFFGNVERFYLSLPANDHDILDTLRSNTKADHVKNDAFQYKHAILTRLLEEGQNT